MFTHMLVGTLVLALVCFGIGLLAGGPDLVNRRRRSKKKLPRRRPAVAAIEVQPVIEPTSVSRADMQIEP